NGLSADRARAGCRPLHALQRRLPARELLDCLPDQLRSRPEQLHLPWESDETEKPVGNEVRGRLVARYEEVRAEGEQFVVGERVTGFVGRDDGRDEIVPWRRAAVVEQLEEIDPEL